MVLRGRPHVPAIIRRAGDHIRSLRECRSFSHLVSIYTVAERNNSAHICPWSFFSLTDPDFFLFEISNLEKFEINLFSHFFQSSHFLNPSDVTDLTDSCLSGLFSPSFFDVLVE